LSAPTLLFGLEATAPLRVAALSIALSLIVQSDIRRRGASGALRPRCDSDRTRWAAPLSLIILPSSPWRSRGAVL
jgi:hypothetical protein